MRKKHLKATAHKPGIGYYILTIGTAINMQDCRGTFTLSGVSTSKVLMSLSSVAPSFTRCPITKSLGGLDRGPDTPWFYRWLCNCTFWVEEPTVMDFSWWDGVGVVC